MKVGAAVLLLLLINAVEASDWSVVGAGNATCEHWNQNSTGQQSEILSWMDGFATSENLDRAASSKPVFRMDLFNHEYLLREIASVCSSAKNANESMISILLEVLTNFPVTNN
jgi:hypothetical protein